MLSIVLVYMLPQRKKYGRFKTPFMSLFLLRFYYLFINSFTTTLYRFLEEIIRLSSQMGEIQVSSMSEAHIL